MSNVKAVIKVCRCLQKKDKVCRLSPDLLEEVKKIIVAEIECEPTATDILNYCMINLVIKKAVLNGHSPKICNLQSKELGNPRGARKTQDIMMAMDIFRNLMDGE